MVTTTTDNTTYFEEELDRPRDIELEHHIHIEVRYFGGFVRKHLKEIVNLTPPNIENIPLQQQLGCFINSIDPYEIDDFLALLEEYEQLNPKDKKRFVIFETIQNIGLNPKTIFQKRFINAPFTAALYYKLMANNVDYQFTFKEIAIILNKPYMNSDDVIYQITVGLGIIAAYAIAKQVLTINEI